MSDKKRLEEIERQIEELRKSLPAHSIPTAMFLKLEDLEEEREALIAEERGEIDASA